MSAREWVDLVKSLGICDTTGHVESCGYEVNDACFCSSLPGRLAEAIEPILAVERERIATAIEALRMTGLDQDGVFTKPPALVRAEAAVIARTPPE